MYIYRGVYLCTYTYMYCIEVCTSIYVYGLGGCLSSLPPVMLSVQDLDGQFTALPRIWPSADLFFCTLYRALCSMTAQQ